MKIRSLFLLSLLSLVSCGDGSTPPPPPRGCGVLMLIDGTTRPIPDDDCIFFRIRDMDPFPYEENVSLSVEVKLLFSFPLDENTIGSALQIEEIGSDAKLHDVTSLGVISVRSSLQSNDTLVWTLNADRLLIPGTFYQVTLNSTYKSKSGLSGPSVSYHFSTAAK